MIPSDVLIAHALAHAPPTKYRFSNALPGAGAGLDICVRIPASTIACGGRAAGAGLQRTISAVRSEPARRLASATCAATVASDGAVCAEADPAAASSAAKRIRRERIIGMRISANKRVASADGRRTECGGSGRKARLQGGPAAVFLGRSGAGRRL